MTQQICDAKYLYHGTAKARLLYIKYGGLLPAEKSRWAKDVGIGSWSIGKIFFSVSECNARFYAEEASKTRPAMLRVKRTSLRDLRADTKDIEGSFYTESAVPPELIEVWNGQKWRPIIIGRKYCAKSSISNWTTWLRMKLHSQAHPASCHIECCARSSAG